MHLSIRFFRTYTGPTPRKIEGIIFEGGYRCRRSCDCPHGYDCKYAPDFRFHNWRIAIRRWIYQKLGIDIKIPIYFQKRRVDFSGTISCPHKVSRCYTCYECQYLKPSSKGEFGLGCTSKDYIQSKWNECHDEDTPRGRCKFFELDPYYENYDRKTGELPWEKI